MRPGRRCCALRGPPRSARAVHRGSPGALTSSVVSRSAVSGRSMDWYEPSGNRGSTADSSMAGGVSRRSSSDSGDRAASESTTSWTMARPVVVRSSSPSESSTMDTRRPTCSANLDEASAGGSGSRRVKGRLEAVDDRLQRIGHEFVVEPGNQCTLFTHLVMLACGAPSTGPEAVLIERRSETRSSARGAAQCSNVDWKPAIFRSLFTTER